MKAGYSDGSYHESEKIYKYGWIDENGNKRTYERDVEMCPEPYSSHYAEYLGVISFISDHYGYYPTPDSDEWELRIDSNLVYFQLIGKWKVNASALKDIYTLTKTLVGNHPIHLKLIRSKDNLADREIR